MLFISHKSCTLDILTLFQSNHHQFRKITSSFYTLRDGGIRSLQLYTLVGGRYYYALFVPCGDNFSYLSCHQASTKVSGCVYHWWLFEVIGYGARAVNAHQAPNYGTMPYAMQSLFILLAPSLFAASIYMVLGRLIRRVDGDSRSIIPSTKLTKIFVVGDVLAFLVQSGGMSKMLFYSFLQSSVVD